MLSSIILFPFVSDDTGFLLVHGKCIYLDKGIWFIGLGGGIGLDTSWLSK